MAPVVSAANNPAVSAANRTSSPAPRKTVAGAASSHGSKENASSNIAAAVADQKGKDAKAARVTTGGRRLEAAEKVRRGVASLAAHWRLLTVLAVCVGAAFITTVYYSHIFVGLLPDAAVVLEAITDFADDCADSWKSGSLTLQSVITDGAMFQFLKEKLAELSIWGAGAFAGAQETVWWAAASVAAWAPASLRP